MCGITGLISFDAALGAEFIEAMTESLSHRGPDDEGYLAVDTRFSKPKVVALAGRASSVADTRIEHYRGAGNVYLGHRRLSIIDLSSAGHQPMQRGQLWLVFNGEIYNYIELRQELKSLGHQFTSSTDTEVILAAYEQWGEDCVNRFNGDWAFCIFDASQKQLFLSRDRYGIKPLYYFSSPDYFCFASEIKALLRLPFVPRSRNRDAAFDYLALFCKDHTDETFYAGIRQLMPAHNASIDLRTGDVRVSQYYRLETNSEMAKYEHRKAVRYAADIRDILIDAVKLRLRSDVPVGTCLSGGLDSSSIVAIVATLRGTSENAPGQNTFTASYPGYDFNESGFADLVVRHTGVTSHLITPSEKGYLETLPTMLYHHDEPFGGTSSYSQWSIMQAASQHVKVMLDGQGADELFGGYRYHRVAFLAQLLRNWRIVRFLKESWRTARLCRDAMDALGELRSVPFFAMSVPWQRRAYRLRYRSQIANAHQMLGLDRTNSEHIEMKWKADLNSILIKDLGTYSLPRLLIAEDRNSMAHAVEARVPFTDFRLVDYVHPIPAAFKIHNGWTKWLLRLAMQDFLPKEIVWRRDKLAFATPAWITRNDEWDFWIQNVAQFDNSKHAATVASSGNSVQIAS